MDIESLSGQESILPAHHTLSGFTNPFPTWEEKGFADFFKWVVIDRINGNKPGRPGTYNFEMVNNDGKLLRSNHTDFTVTWIGHSTLLIQLEGMNILTDPIWSDRASPVQFIGPKRYMPPGLALQNLPAVDIVLISHDHYDHLDRLTLKELGNNPRYLVPLGVGKFLEEIGITNYEELDWGDIVSINGMKFICTPAQHFSGRTAFNRNKTLWCSWVIAGKENRVYFAGDTGYFPGFTEIATQYGPFDIAAIPIGAYLPRWFMKYVHLSPQEAVQVFKELKAEVFIPIHWGTFALADEPLDNPPAVLNEIIESEKLAKDKFWILKHGETRQYLKNMDSENQKPRVELSKSR